MRQGAPPGRLDAHLCIVNVEAINGANSSATRRHNVVFTKLKVFLLPNTRVFFIYSWTLTYLLTYIYTPMEGKERRNQNPPIKLFGVEGAGKYSIVSRPV